MCGLTTRRSSQRRARDLRALSPQARRSAGRPRARKRADHRVALHSFTPVYAGVARPWHIGTLYHRRCAAAASAARRVARRQAPRGRRQPALCGERDDRLLHSRALRAAQAHPYRHRNPAGSDRRSVADKPNGRSGWRTIFDAVEPELLKLARGDNLAQPLPLSHLSPKRRGKEVTAAARRNRRDRRGKRDDPDQPRARDSAVAIANSDGLSGLT